MRILKTFMLLLAAGFALCSAAPNFQCARYCKEAAGSFGYQIGTSYKYQYSGTARTLVNTTSQHVVDQSGVNIDCVVTFEALSTCDYVMEILEVYISDFHVKSMEKTISPDRKFHKLEMELKANSLHFAFNGKVDTICPDKSESKEIIDIKRGILSVFQNSNPGFKENALVYESDITGNCETHYRVATGQDGVRHVNKTKNLDACDHRMSNYFSWQTVPYTTTTHSKSIPLLKSTLNCMLTYEDILMSSKCFEKHVFQPFSNGDNGALTTIEQELKFLSMQESLKRPTAPKDVKRSTLLYEYNADKMAANTPSVALAILKQLEEKTADGVDMDVPGIFSKLVFEFQRLSKAHLLAIFQQINPKQRSFYTDAISLITTNSGIEVMSELYENKKLDDKQMNAWLISVNFIKQPNKQTVELINPLIYHSKLKQKALLSLSSVLYKYCSKQNCLEDIAILEILKNIEKPISNNCIITSETEKREIFMALKSIGNAGLTTSYYNLQNCYLNNELPVELRLAAIAAHRRMKCAENENLDDFKSLLSNSRANSEVRIASYLATMQCASYASFAQVKDVLIKEEANQVGSFIWTHLTNLQETSVPWKQGIRKLLENEFLQNKFNTDVRKYSRNYEASTFFDSVGAGGGVETNVIFTSESYLPRSAMLNFTLDLFGETINVLEVGSRLEGFEDIVENLFNAPEEPENVPTTENLGTANSNLERLDEFGEMFKVLPKQPAGSGYIKIFGNEISYAEFTSLKDIFGSSISGKAALDMLLQFMKVPEVDYTKSISLLDSTYKIPTVLGFPLQLKANATTTLGLTAGGELNIKDIRSHKMLVKGRVYPSVSVQVACTMSLDTYQGETGVQYVGALKSNMYIDGYINLEMGRVVDVKVNVPKKQMDIFTVTSDLYILHNDESFAIQDVSNDFDNSEYCTDQYISKMVGLQFCNQWRFINASSLRTPSFPLTGAFKYSMHIKKTDSFDFFKLYVETKLADPDRQYLIDFLLDTPNSKVDRRLQCTLAADLQNLKFSIHMHSPFANFQLQSQIERELPKYKFHLMTRFNDKEVVTLISTFDVKDEGETVTYEPLAQINYKQQQIAALTGKLSRVKGGEYSADLKLQGITNDVAQIYGSFTCGGDYLTIKTNIISIHFKGTLEAGLNVRSNEVTAQANLNYNYNNLVKEVLKFVGKFNRSSSEALSKNLFLLDFDSSEWPKYNTHVQWENQRGPLFFNNTAEVMLFESTWRTHQIVKLDRGFYDEEPDMLLLADLESPQNNIDYQSKLQFSMSRKYLKAHALLKVSKVQKTEALVDYTSRSTEDTMKVLLYYAKKSWGLDGVLNKTIAGNYNFDITSRFETLDQDHVILTLRGDYKHSSLGELQTHMLNCTLNLPETSGEWRTPWVITSTVQKSHTTFLSLTKVATKEADYAGHFNWIEDSVALSIQADDKQLFILNGARTEEIVSIVVALNIHQHFELNTKLMMPYQRFDLQVYWDKDRDETQRFAFSIQQNSYKGQYNMEIEYPTQRITTNILLVPTTVIMNVTWGIEVSQKIYLKVGNKYYDDGGIWFGKLETPFRYLEMQQFYLQYAVVSDSFDVQSDLSWRSHSIKLLIAGSKSDTHLRGNLQLNTTLPEIRRVGAVLSHTHQLDFQSDLDGYQSDYQSNALFDYNDHSVQAESRWLVKGDRVDSRFRIESPTHTIQPIFGELKLNDLPEDEDPDASNMNFVLSWQKKNITAMYNFKRDTSSIEINTPFEGIEKTIMKYSVVTSAESVYLSTTVDVFKQNNSITLSWTNTNDSTSFWLDMMSPMTGGYYVYFTHSVLLGKLNENFKIHGPGNKDLLQMKIEGDIMPLMKMNVTASLVLLDHNAMLTITNSKEPLVSNVIATWNGRLINSKVSLKLDDSQLSLLNWLVESNLFAPVNVSYERNTKECLTTIILPNDYSMTNKFLHSSPYWNNQLRLRAPNLLLEFDHLPEEDTTVQTLKAQLNEKKIEYEWSVLTVSGNENHLGFNGTYSFYDGIDLIHSYQLHSLLQQTFDSERFHLDLNSTSTLNGHMNIHRQISPALSDNSMRISCEFPTYCDLEATVDNQHFLWNDKLKNKKLNLTYNTDATSLTAKLTTTYESIPSGDLHLEYLQDKFGLQVNVIEYHFNISSDLNLYNTLIHLKKDQKDLARFTLELRGIRKLNSSLEINNLKRLNATFSYSISPSHFELLSTIDTAFNRAQFQSKFDNLQNKRVNGFIEGRYNDEVYSSSISCTDKQFDLVLKTPKEEYNGKMHQLDNRLLRTLDIELSSQSSKNYFTLARKMDGLQFTAGSDYLKLPPQEFKYSWLSWKNFNGEGHYISGPNKYRFTTRSKSWQDLSLAYYLPSGLLFFNVNVNGRFKSKRDFDATIDGTWDGRKIHFDLKNYFGDYFQTTFNLITPIKGWSRTSLDCTLNDQKIGIALQAKGHYMSILAGRSGDDMLRIEYMGETLLEMSSNEGHLTLRTTSYLGKYRLFIQATYTPGIYVFSILRDGENLISFMLQNYSINEVLHYKGKLMAPEIIPNNSTLSVEFMANAEVWKLFDFKMKKDHKPLLELGWQNNRHKHGLDGSLKFHSQIDPVLNFQLRPSFTISDGNVLDVDVEMKYPCKKHSECSFSFVLTPTRMVCNSLSSVEILNFQIQSNFDYGQTFVNANFDFNDFKHTNIGFNLSGEVSNHMAINGIANFKGHSALLSLTIDPRNVQLELATSHGHLKKYLLAKSQLHTDHIVLDLHLPQNQCFPNITIRGNVSLKQGLVTVAGNHDQYQVSWRTTMGSARSDFTVDLVENGVRTGGVAFDNTVIKGHGLLQSDSVLHVTYQEHNIDAVFQGLLTNDSAWAIGSLITTWEPIKLLRAGFKVKYTGDEVQLEQFLKLVDKEFKLNANALTTKKAMVVQLMCKPWGPNKPFINETISANIKYDPTGGSHNFEVDLGMGTVYQVKAQPHIQDSYVIEVTSKEYSNRVARAEFNKTSIQFEAKSFGIVDELVLHFNARRFVMRGHVMGYGQSLILQDGVFGLDFHPQGHEKVTVLYKVKGGELPPGMFIDFKDHDFAMVAGFLDNMIKLTAMNQTANNTVTLEVKAGKDYLLRTTLEDTKEMYKLTTASHQKTEESLIVYKSFNRVINDIYLPFQVNLNFATPRFELTSTNCTVSMSRNQQHIDIKVLDNHFAFEYDHRNKNGLLVHYERNHQILHFETGRYHNLEFTLNNGDVLSVKYDLHDGLVIKFKQILLHKEVECDLVARSVHDITFEILTDQERNVLWKSFLDDSSISYQFMAPKWKLLREFDIAVSWVNNTDGNVFGVALKLDSEYTGPTEVGTVYEEKQFLLNIESYFKAPFLKGLETFYGKVYIPEEFRPHLEFVIPGQTYKFYYNHQRQFTEMEVICRNEHFTLVMNDSHSNDITVQLEFPDERFKSLMLRIINYSSIHVDFNDEYSLNANWDLTNVNVKTPHQGLEKFGYLYEKAFTSEHGELKLVIWHPRYLEPLGIAFKLNQSNEAVSILYSIHAPYSIDGYDFATINLTTKFIPDGFDGYINIITNKLDMGTEFGFVLSDHKKLLHGHAHYNLLHYIGVLNIEEDKFFIIIGDPQSKGNNIGFLDTFPEFERFVSETLYMIYVRFQGNNFDLLAHFGDHPFSLRRSENQFVKLIWDLRKPNETALGLKYIPSETIEMYLADNHIMAKQHTNNTSNGLSLHWNDLNLEYSSLYTNFSVTRGVYNVTSIRRVQTPLGSVHLRKYTSTATAKLIDRVEIDWTGVTAEQPSKLIFNYEITPGTLTSTVSSSMLPHPLILHVDMSEFRAIPSKLKARFYYSNDTEKTIDFSMLYNKTYLVDATGESVLTDRVFILKHPSSKVDYELYFDAIRMEDFSNGSVTLRYKDFDTQKVETMHGSVKVDHSKFGVHAEIATARNRFDLMATSTTGVKRHGFLVHIEINDKDPLNLECTYNFQKDSPSMSLMAAYGTSRKYLFYAGMPNEKEITAKLGHESYGRPSLDALAIVKLNTSQLLWMKVLWKDNLFAPFQEAILDEYNDLRYVIEAMGKELIDVIHDDVGKDFISDASDIKNAVVNHTMTDLQRAIDHLHKRDVCQNNLKSICRNTEFRNLVEILKENLIFIYDMVEFTVQSSFKSVQFLLDAVNVEIDKAMKDIKNIQHIKVDAKGILKRGINTARKSLKDMERVLVKILDDFDQYVGSVKAQVEEFFNPFLSLVDDFIVYVEQRLAMLQIAVLDTMDSIQQYIYNLREIKAMFSVYYSYINWLEELHFIKMLDPVTDIIEEILETIIQDVKRILDHYKPYLDALGDAIFGKYDSIQQLPPIVEVREHVNRIYHKTIWVWNYHNMTKALKTCVQKFSRDVDNVLSIMEFEDFPGSNEDVEYPFGYNYVFRPENRLIEISQPLPVEWETFNKSPSFENYPLYQRIQGKSEQFIKFYKSRYDLIDMLENFVVDLYEPSIAPSTLNYAMMIGKSQYTTFNGFNYNFISNCSYLLASDFKTRSFSLIVNYRNTTKGNIVKTYEILSNDSTFQIFSEKEVTLNGRKVELPIVYKQVTITREKDNIIAESSRGFKMICYFHYDYCTVQLSGWLFGKTAGLLGTLDNEQYTDVMARKSPSGIIDFLQSWQLQKDARCSLEVSPDKRPDTEYVKQLCELWFNDTNSPLSKCYDAVDPTSYEEICYNELKANPSLKICAPAAAYVHRCRQARVVLDMPEFCVTCQDDIGYNEQIFDGHNNKTVDVVFITELDCHNETQGTRALPEVLHEKLLRKHFVGNRYATVGYGGYALPKPHVHTHDGNIWSYSEKVNIPSRLSVGNMSVKSKFTGVDAMKYAANLEYRVGVPKLFILLQCEVATDIGNSPDIYNMLGEKDITLHVLKPKPFGARDLGILGMDLTEVIMTSSGSGNSRDIPVNQIINQIDDVYSGLALSTNGTIFDLSSMGAADRTVQWGRSVVRGIRASPCQKCKCVQDHNGVGKIECSRCLAPAVKQFLSEYEEGNKMQFNDNDDNQ